MKTLLKILGILLLVVALAAGGGFLYMEKAFPKVGAAAAFTIENKTDPALIARGEYLVHHVTGCVDCHTPRDVNTWAVPRIAGKEGMGGMAFTKDLGFPGNFYSKNITEDKETGIGSWTDAQLFHTITTGVRQNGEPLFPVMPYKHYGTSDPEDLKAIIAYIRTLAPINNKVPESAADFPVNLIMRTIPSDAAFTRRPDTSNTIAYGKYLVNMAACEECHTKRDDKGNLVAGMQLAGDNKFVLKGMGTVRSANLTPDMETGIGAWTKEMFIHQFKQYDGNDSWRVPWQQKHYQTIMPWPEYCGMTERDLGAIYDYLRTLPPVKNRVTKWTPEGEEATAAK